MTPEQKGADRLVLEGAQMLSAARAFVAERLAAMGRTDVSGDAQLIASELVTNVFLHAGGAAQLTVSAVPEGVRIEVGDTSSTQPVRLDPGGDSMTGRGLHLVEGIAARWGVTATGSGKVVWAELHDGVPSSPPPQGLDEEALLAMWDDSGWDEADPAATADAPDEAAAATRAPSTIALGTVPTALLLEAKAHVDNLVREFTLMAGGSASGASTEVPPAVTQLIDVVVDGFSAPRQALKRLALQAASAEERQVEVLLPVPDDVAATIQAGETYLDALDQANAFCRAVRLLTLESPPQHRIFHRWYVEEYLTALRRLHSPIPYTPQRFEERLLHELDTVAAAHRVADRAARLHSLAVALSAALTSEAVAAAVLDEGVAALGAAGGVVMLATDSTTLAVPGAVGHDDAVMARLRDEHPGAALPAAQAMRTGEAVWLESLAERNERFPDLIGFEPDTVAMCAVPVALGARRLGALRFSFTEARLFDEEERQFINAMAAQSAQALHRAELYQQRIDVAERLQATLLPSRLPDIPGMDLAAAYHPLTDALDVGGDFYDVWQCAPDHWALAIGDVCGSGPEAAALTGLVRHTLRALTATSLSIEEILLRLNQSLLAAAEGLDGERFCTVALAFLNLEGGTAAVDVASGGHPAPLVVRGDGTVDEVQLRGTLLGVLGDIEVDRQHLELQPGETLILVTDGATEARRGGAMLGLHGVKDAASEPATSAAETVRAIEQAVRDHGGGRLHDDLALLSLRRL